MVATALPDRLRKQIEALPARPGVYLMRNQKGEVIYVGKAARLKDRVRSYFGSPRSLEPKTRALRADIEDFEYIVCANAGEALILEATLIKRHQPFFNIRLKDDKRYPYLKIDVQNPWPRVYITRRIEKDGARYFGPYASAGSVRATLDLLKKLFPYRSCTKEITGKDPRPCLDYYIKRCIAPCTAYCTSEEYAEVIDQIILFLEGKASAVLDRLGEQMDGAAESLDYERAAMLRDQIRAIERTVERQMLSTTKKEDLDVYGLAREGDRACVQVFFVRGTQMTGRDHFVLEGVTGESDEAVLGSLLQQYYESAQSIPKLVVVPIEPEGRVDLEAVLTEKRAANVEIRVAQRGEKRQLLQMAGENAAEALDNLKVRWLSDQTKTATALEELREELALPELPHRIECYDNSNLQGASPVSSMVVFLDGQPAPRQYRKFRIKTVEGADDFATMQEVLRRRFKRAARQIEQQTLEGGEARDTADNDSWDLPDLVVVDGGKGQLGAAVEVMRELGVYDIPTVGLAKRHEELFAPDEEAPIVLPRGSEALYLVQRVRDEAHRFAITYHRQVRRKAATASVLDSIPGVGPKRKRALLRKFGSLKAVREAGVDEIASTAGYTRSLAEKVKEYV
ncbi:MAG: excinuclease ABC subunit UvrC [Dehalococcoidia bacterium]|nr:excinuclease ABC subunit UvrC [Dehalococcoidia bacterium]MYI85468.1 excinuclease ABC subunit UvrC [Dehalococcoidia bacterium]